MSVVSGDALIEINQQRQNRFGREELLVTPSRRYAHCPAQLSVGS
jgi:hypothetical protein